MTGKRVVFRVDASVAMGTGHVMRCLTLADALQRLGWQCDFVARAHQGNLAWMMNDKGYRVWTLPAPRELHPRLGTGPTHAPWLGVEWEQDASETRDILVSVRPDWLVVDHYALDDRWENAVVDQANSLMVIDDLADRPHTCHLLLDQNLGRHVSDYRLLVPRHCKTLAGSEYVLLRPEFRAFRQQSLVRRQQRKFGRILIFLGGSDPANVTGAVLSALADCELPEDMEVDVVAGPASPWAELLGEQVASLPFRATLSVGVNDMAKRMSRADVAIGAAGVATWERCCLGLPSLVVAIADNQKLFLDEMAAHGMVRTSSVETLEEDIVGFIDEVRQDSTVLSKLSHASARWVDGLGTDRVVTQLSGMA